MVPPPLGAAAQRRPGWPTLLLSGEAVSAQRPQRTLDGSAISIASSRVSPQSIHTEMSVVHRGTNICIITG